MSHDIARPTADVGNPASRVLSSPSRLKVAPFSPNAQRGGTPTTAEGSIAELDWAQQVRIARAAEDAGIEAVIPVARWRGYGGPSKYHTAVYETMPWAAGLLAATDRIVVFATTHVPLIHPVRAAKEIATIDHISGGRFALNIVSGWNDAEFAMFGLLQPGERRYDAAAEWAEFVKKLWATDDEFDFHGEFYDSVGAMSEPKPIQRPRPPIMSAGSSDAGRDFAVRHADICLALGEDLATIGATAVDIKERAERVGRPVSVWTSVGMICGDTEADAQRQFDHFVHERGDRVSGENQLRAAMGGGSATLNLELSPAMIDSSIAFTFAHQMVGSAEQIVDKMGALADAGIDGMAVIWVDYERGIERFKDEVQPLAVDAGLRAP